MKQVLGGTGKVAILVGSLTAANATQRIAGFEAGARRAPTSRSSRRSTTTCQASHRARRTRRPSWRTTRTSTACTACTPTTARRSPRPCKSAGKTGTVTIVSDDSDAQTLGFIKSGVISGTVVQMPYEQGYTGAYILAAEKVLGKAATMAIVKPYLSSDGFTLSSGVGLVTKSDLSWLQLAAERSSESADE